MGTRKQHIRGAIVNTNGTPTKVFYDLLDRLTTAAESDDTTELLTLLQGPSSDTTNLQASVNQLQLSNALVGGDDGRVAELSRRLDALENIVMMLVGTDPKVKQLQDQIDSACINQELF